MPNNSHDDLAKWILDPPALKPGTAMPKLGLSADEAAAAAAYLYTSSPASNLRASLRRVGGEQVGIGFPPAHQPRLAVGDHDDGGPQAPGCSCSPSTAGTPPTRAPPPDRQPAARADRPPAPARRPIRSSLPAIAPPRPSRGRRRDSPAAACTPRRRPSAECCRPSRRRPQRTCARPAMSLTEPTR